MNTAAYPAAPPAPETLRLARRFFWKECRVVSGLALGTAGLGVVGMAILRAFIPPTNLSTVMLGAAFGAAALFAVAAAVALFSMEREEGTDALLRSLPRNQAAMVLGKLAAAVAMTIAVLALLAGAGIAMARGELPQPDDARSVLWQGSAFVAEGLAWGVLASVLIRQPLLAAVAALAMASVSSQLAILTVPGSRGYTLEDYHQAMPARFALVLLAVSIGGRVAWRWLDPAERVDSAPRRSAAWRERWAGGWGGLARMQTRLIWQTHKQSWKPALAALGIGFVLTVCWLFMTEWATSVDGGPRTAGPASAMCLAFAPAIMGAMVFRGDQRHRQHRFLAEHAARPRQVWFARQAVWLSYLLLSLLAVTSVVNAVVEQMIVPQERYWGAMSHSYDVARQLELGQQTQIATLGVATMWWVGIATFAWGQLCSMAIRSEILAGMFAIFLSMLLAVWGLLCFTWRLPPVWFVAPLGAGALLATLLRSPAWLFERREAWRWAAPAAAVLAPAVAVALSIAPTRMGQIAGEYEPVSLEKNGPSGGSYSFVAMIAARADAAEQEQRRGRDVMDGYLRLDPDLDDDWIDRFIELSQVDCRLPPMTTGEPKGAQVALLVERMLETLDDGVGVEARLERLLACRRLEVQWAQGIWPELDPRAVLMPWRDLEEAIVAWATAPEQTAERILDAVERIREIERPLDDPTGRLLMSYLDTRRVLRGERAPAFLEDGRDEPRLGEWLPYVLHRFPGEQERSIRAWGLLTAPQFDLADALWRRTRVMDEHLRTHPEALRQLEARPNGGVAGLNAWGSEASVITSAGEVTSWQPGSRQAALNYALVRQARTSLLAAAEASSHWRGDDYLRSWLRELSWRRAEMLRLTLIAYRVEHGEYPATLEDLLQDSVDPALLFDPLTGAPYRYSREGLDFAAWRTQYGGIYDSIPPGTPLLWSAGPSNAEPEVESGVFKLNSSGTIIEVHLEGHAASVEAASEYRDLLVRLPWDGFWMPLPD